MARGWESKSVEAQIDAAGDAGHHTGTNNSPDPETLNRIRRKENLLLSRTRVKRQLNGTTNKRYQEQLRKALLDLDAQLKALGPV